MVGPIIDELATEYEGKVIIGKCDVDENGDVAAEYGIRNIPTVLFFKNGELVDKQVGSAPKSAYVAKIEKRYYKVLFDDLLFTIYPFGIIAQPNK